LGVAEEANRYGVDFVTPSYTSRFSWKSVTREVDHQDDGHLPVPEEERDEYYRVLRQIDLDAAASVSEGKYQNSTFDISYEDYLDKCLCLSPSSAIKKFLLCQGYAHVGAGNRVFTTVFMTFNML